MLFGLKNAGATYRLMVTRMFREQIGKTVEVYIDDMVVKSKKPDEHISNLAEVFEILRHHKLHLNAAKCAFGVGSRKFLSFMIACRGIEVKPNQIKTIQQLSPLSNPKEV